MAEQTFTVSGPDVYPLVRALARGTACAGLPEVVVLDRRTERKGTATWLDVTRTARMVARANWANGATISFHPHDPTSAIGARFPGMPLAVAPVLAAFDELPFELGILASPFVDLFRRYDAPGFSDRHQALGWGCLFKGAGHDRLVTRRWLDFGPWLVHRGPHDTTLVQFHDLTAAEDVAIEQMRPGHARMGITQTGGFIQTDYVYRHRPEGLYVASDRSLRILINGRTVSPVEMLDAKVFGYLRRNNAETPIASVRFIYVEGEARARQDLHELWLRGLECWAIVGGVEKRLDADYAPVPPPPPAWARVS